MLCWWGQLSICRKEEVLMKKKTKQADPAAWLQENKWTCAVLAAAVRTGRCGRRAAVRLPGGVLELDWDRDSGHIWMTGPAVTVFEGEVD